MAGPKQTTTKEASATAGGSSMSASTGTQQAKPKKAKEEPDEPGFFAVKYQSFRKWLTDTSSEIRKITWPDQETVQNLTVLVVAMATLLGIILGGIDYVLLKLFETI